MAGSEVRLQNMALLCKELRLPVAYKVHEVVADEGSEKAEAVRNFLVVVHVLSDHAFKKFMTHCSFSDMLLYRGLLLKMSATPSLDRILSACVQQTFLPKFENEGQDSSIADAIVAGADERYMVVTIKHSGSLVTLSGAGFAAKNSINNEYTAGAEALLQAHFERSCLSVTAGQEVESATKRLKRFMSVLEERRMAVSFEMVTGCHGHHGQLPQGEYLVTTSAHTADADGHPSFLSWKSFLSFCIEQGLPMNDTWLIAGPSWANAVRDTLDDLALSGGPTKSALKALDNIVTDGSSSGCVHLPGTYPHHSWQGSRIEGFVIAQGEEVSADAAQLLAQLRPAMQQAVLPYESTPQELRRPYQDMLTAAQGNVEQVKSRLADATSSWLPAPKLVTVSGAERDSLVNLLINGSFMKCDAEGNTSMADGGSWWAKYRQYMTVASSAAAGMTIVCSRREMQSCSAQLALELLDAAAAAAAAQAPGAPKPAAVEEARSCIMSDSQGGGTGEGLTDAGRVKLIQALSGAAKEGSSTALRYKKKMLMWSRNSSEGDVEIGYCMMTFVIRNGLQALGMGLPTYMGYVENLVRNWALPSQHAAQVRMFATAWAKWYKAHGGPGAVSSERYLDVAEPFVRAFIAAGCCAGGDGSLGQDVTRPKDAFQGVLALMDVPDEVANALKDALQVQNVIEAAAEVPEYRKSMVEQGTILRLNSEQPPPKNFRNFLECVGPYMLAIVKRPMVPEGCDPNSAPIKKLKGVHQGKVKQIELAMQGSKKGQKGVDASAVARRITYLPEDGAANVEELKLWLGSGMALPECDPAAICCFISLPGTGKSALTEGLDKVGVPSLGGAPACLKVLNSDRMKKTIKNFAANRYWHEVAAAADTQVGGGSVTVVVADKNLVPSPPGNIDRVLNILKDSGAASVAIVPTCVGGSTSCQLKPALYQSLPDLPFPLEMVALCMLRTLQRKKHEGNLDASLPEALSVVCKFADFFRNNSCERLMQRLGSCFTKVVELPIMSVPEGAQQLQVPEELLQHIAVGIATGGEVSPGWEPRCRELLLQPATSASLLALQRPLESCRADLQNALAASLASIGSVSGTATSSSTSLAQPSISTALATLLPGSLSEEAVAGISDKAQPARPRYIAVAGFDAGPLVEAARKLIPQEAGGKMKEEFHVTLWHAEDPEMGQDQVLLDQLMECIGQEVVVEVLSIDSSPRITAAQVQLLSGPESCYKKSYFHITLIIGEDAQAKDSNLLPGMLEAGTASRVVLPDGCLQLTGGQILAFMTD